jgi:hypothetical protein
MSTKKRSSFPLAAISPPAMPTLSAFCHRIQTTGSSSTPRASASAETHALLVATFAANEPAGAEE